MTLQELHLCLFRFSERIESQDALYHPLPLFLKIIGIFGIYYLSYQFSCPLFCAPNLVESILRA